MNNHFIIRWFRVILPFYLIPVTAFFVWLLLAPNLSFELLNQVNFFIFLYGMFRGGVFHPVYDQDYLDWIISTPWSKAQPVPFGSIQLRLQDAVVIGSMTLMAYPSLGMNCLYVPYMFILGYIVTQMLSFLHLKQWFDFFVQAFSMGLMVILFLNLPLWVSILFTGVLYIFTANGVRRYLSRLSRRESGILNSFNANQNPHIKPITQQLFIEVGWPFSSLIPLPVSKPQRKILIVCWALLAGWIYFVAGFVFMQIIGVSVLDPVALETLDLQTSYFFRYLPIGVAISFFILKIFRSQTFLKISPPISLIGRVFSGRWIIPRYDRFFAPEIIALTCGIIAPLLLQLLPLSSVLIGTISITLITFVLLALQEDFNHWLLTSKCILKKPIIRNQ